jgi:hypothetical protein
MTPYNPTVAEQLDPIALYATGWTPETRGTLLIQNLCRECYFEMYNSNNLPPDSLPVTAEPFNLPPVVSAGPESWVQVPVAGSVPLALFMNGNNFPDHVNEVTLWWLPGACQIGGGPMGRHPLTP